MKNGCLLSRMRWAPAVLALAVCGASELWAQAPARNPTHTLVPRRGAPASRIDDGGAPAEAPVDNRRPHANSLFPNRSSEPAEQPVRAGGPNEADPAHDAGLPRRAPALGLPDAQSPLAHVQAARQKLRPPELLAEALQTPHEAALQGQDLTLLAAINRTPDRQQQLKVIQVYWKLSAAQGDYHFAHDQRMRLQALTQSHTILPAVLSAREAARALVDDAQLDVLKAQHELAEQISLLAADPLPLAVDRPHVGDYRTAYEAAFNGRAPARIRLIHDIMPLRRRAIDAHGAAILSALDALDSIGDEYAKDQVDTPTLVAALGALGQRRRAFMAAVRDYNMDIAEYAVTVAPPEATEPQLVSMLIKTSAPQARSSGGGEPAHDSPRPEAGAPSKNPSRTFLQPSSEAPGSGYVPSGARLGEGGFRPGDERSAVEQPTEAPAEAVLRSSQYPPSSGTRPGAAPNNGVSHGAPRSATPHAAPHDSNPSVASSRIGVAGHAGAKPAGTYAGLLEVERPARAQKLAGSLHWNHADASDASQSVSLLHCLSRVAPENRPALLNAYWRARETAARHQAMVDIEQQIDLISPRALQMRQQAAEAMVRLQAARKAAEADRQDEAVALRRAEFRLTLAAGGSLDEKWFSAATAPHAGRYRMNFESLPPQLARSRRLKLVADSMPLLERELESLSAAVVYADSARAELSDDVSQHQAFSTELALISRQSQATLAFLGVVTQYNLAIGDYVLAVMPRDAPADKLVGALVVSREPKAGS